MSTQIKPVPVKVRRRDRRGGRPREGLDHTWTEWQVVSGRRIVSRHDFEEQATEAAAKLRTNRQQRVCERT